MPPHASASAADSAARQHIENEVERMRLQGIGADGYFGLLELYPALQRVFFIHIPKCGGTSIRKVLAEANKCAPVPLPRSGTIDQAISYMASSCPRSSPEGQLLRSYLADDTGLDRAARFLHIYAAYQLTQNPERMYILGHKQAREMLRYYRADTDFFFTTVRAPAEILKSLVAFRVSHTLKDDTRLDSMNLLKGLQMTIGEFTEAVASRPLWLAEQILTNKPPSLASFLSFDRNSDCATVLQGIKDRNVFIAHMSEQSLLLSNLFGEQTTSPRENNSDNRRGLAAEFASAIQLDWISPFVDPESTQIYQRLEAGGIIGYWKNGGTKAGYLELLKHL